MSTERITTPRAIGTSKDGRTNRWSVTCPKCGRIFSPRTTRLSSQTFDCANARCAVQLYAEYNANPPTVQEVDPS